MFKYVRHLLVSRRIKKLIKDTPIEKSLYWYDLPIKNALGFSGLREFRKFAKKGRLKDEIAQNYSLKRLYYGPSVGDGIMSSGATVWNYRKLNSPPVIRDDAICHILEKNAETIISEYRENIDKIIEHPDNTSLAEDGDWSGVFLIGVGGKTDPDIQSAFPKTFEALKKIPISKNFGFVLISKLSPGVKILPHCGSSNLRFRYHLGLDVPEPESVKLRVGERWIGWQEGKAFGFDDSYEHEVVHSGSDDRVVLVVDAWNPELTSEEIKIFDNKLFHKFGTA